MLKAEWCPVFLAGERNGEEGYPILPKRALSLVGYWNILPNDLLIITPALVAAIEAKGEGHQGIFLYWYGFGLHVGHVFILCVFL